MKKFKLLLIGILLASSFTMFAQQTVKGVVKEKASGDPLPGVSVIVKGTAKGSETDFNGRFTISNVKTGDVLIFRYLGYADTEVTIANNFNLTVALEESSEQLEEIVVVGYGTAKKEDVTGAADLITPKDFNKGPIVSPQQLISGRIAGVNVTSGSGAPGDGQNISIRGLGSLSLDSSPLIVVDGIPLNNGGVGGTRNPLNLINPNDIASLTVLKDASATSIYGSRGANGVIIISTKKGKNTDFKFNFNSFATIHDDIDRIDVLSSDQFRNLVTATNNSNAINTLGNANTDWQNQIYRLAFGSDNSFSALGSIKNVPVRVSLGYSNHDGILKGDNFERITGSLNVNPNFLDDHLKLDVNIRGSRTNNTFANRGAIGSAVAFDPTQPVFDTNSTFDNYFTWTQPNGAAINLAPINPVALLNLIDDTAKINRFIANAKIDYKLPFLKNITATISTGYDKSDSEGNVITSALFPTSDTTWNGSTTKFTQEATNKLFDVYVTYNKILNDKHDFNFVVGHSYQSFEFDNYSFDSEKQEDNLEYEFYDSSKNVLLSYFGRANYNYDGKYLITATLRADASSKLNPNDRWGYFPSLALAWNIHKEDFMENTIFNEFKIRAGYGEVGNVNGLGDYRFLTRYTASQQTANYQFGNAFLQTYRPEPISDNLKWEIGRTLNLGIDYSLLDRRISGTLNAYIKDTQDLIAFTFTDPFTNFGNRIDKNIGDMRNKGIEFSITGSPIKNEDLQWDINYNVAYNKNEVTNLPDQQFVGGISGGVGNTIQTHIEGEAPFSFLVYQQVYDNNGKPLEGVFVDRNSDNIINDDDKYIHSDPYADIIMGLSTSVNYKNLDFTLVSRASFGNYVYNNVASSSGYFERVVPTTNDYLTNLHSDYLTTGFQNITENNLLSDHYLTDASFFKIDNITVGYTLNKFSKHITNLRFYGSVQNVLTISDYDGIDPEISGGIDNNFYPRPRSFVMGVNLDF